MTTAASDGIALGRYATPDRRGCARRNPRNRRCKSLRHSNCHTATPRTIEETGRFCRTYRPGRGEGPPSPSRRIPASARSRIPLRQHASRASCPLAHPATATCAQCRPRNWLKCNVNLTSRIHGGPESRPQPAPTSPDMLKPNGFRLPRAKQREPALDVFGMLAQRGLDAHAHVRSRIKLVSNHIR